YGWLARCQDSPAGVGRGYRWSRLPGGPVLLHPVLAACRHSCRQEMPLPCVREGESRGPCPGPERPDGRRRGSRTHCPEVDTACVLLAWKARLSTRLHVHSCEIPAAGSKPITSVWMPRLPIVSTLATPSSMISSRGATRALVRSSVIVVLLFGAMKLHG